MTAKYIKLVISIIFAFQASAESDVKNWFLPQTLSDKNVTVTFDVDSTWHVVHGVTSEISGSAILNNYSDPTSVEVKFEVPVDKFNTDNSMRDEQLREVMASKEYPSVKFESNSSLKKCTPVMVLDTGKCEDVLSGVLTIRSTKMPVNIPIIINKKDAGFEIKGTLPVDWPKFGVEDPSILVAKVEPIAVVNFSVALLP